MSTGSVQFCFVNARHESNATHATAKYNFIIVVRFFASVPLIDEREFADGKYQCMPYCVCNREGQTGVTGDKGTTGDKGPTGDKGTTGDVGEFDKDILHLAILFKICTAVSDKKWPVSLQGRTLQSAKDMHSQVIKLRLLDTYERHHCIVAVRNKIHL